MDKKVIEKIIGEKLERIYLSRNAEKGGCYRLILNFENGISLTITGSPLCIESGIWEMIPAEPDGLAKKLDGFEGRYNSIPSDKIEKLEVNLPAVDDKDTPPMPEVKEPPEFKPCPFCGSIDVNYAQCQSVNHCLDKGAMKILYHCGNCGASGPASEDKEKAKMLWNHRDG